MKNWSVKSIGNHVLTMHSNLVDSARDFTHSTVKIAHNAFSGESISACRYSIVQWLNNLLSKVAATVVMVHTVGTRGTVAMVAMFLDNSAFTTCNSRLKLLLLTAPSVLT